MHKTPYSAITAVPLEDVRGMSNDALKSIANYLWSVAGNVLCDLCVREKYSVHD